MKKLILVFLVFFIPLTAFSTPMGFCTYVTPNPSPFCPGGFGVLVTNNCPVPIYARVCMQTFQGHNTCFESHMLPPGATDSHMNTCYATGQFQWASCSGGPNECGHMF